MKLFRREVELVVIRDIFDPRNNLDVYKGYDLEALVKEAFGGNRPLEDVRFYTNGSLIQEIFPPESRKDKKAIAKFCSTKGQVFAIVKPMGIGAFIAYTIVSTLVTVAISLLMPQPEIPNNPNNSPPSPNTALAARGNQQRLGGRIPDIFGTVWSIPDLIAPTYSVYVDNKEVEHSVMCVGRGRFNVTQALDDTTPITQVFGSTVLVYDPQDSLDDEPAFQFGNTLTPDEAANARLFAKRYTAVNGQILAAPDAYLDVKATFSNPNILQVSDNVDLRDYFTAGDSLLVEGATNLASGNNILDGNGDPVTYTLNGQYTINTVAEKSITLVQPELVNTDWQKLIDNTDFTVESEQTTISKESQTFWQGWHYTDLKDHDRAYYNVVATQGLYDNEPSGRWKGIRIYGKIESELVDSSNNAIAGTLHTQTFSIESPDYDLYGSEGFASSTGYYEQTTSDTNNENVRRQAAKTVFIENPNFVVGTRIRSRIARTSIIVTDESGGISDEIRIKDFYGASLIKPTDIPSNVTKVYAKTVATEGALAVKERRLRLLVQRYVQDAITGIEALSNRADDILRTVMTDTKIGNLSLSQMDMQQIKDEIDAQIAYFGTPLCAEFCGTFDDKNTSAEEIIFTIGQAVFCQPIREENKIRLRFERESPASVAVFNSHNILPNSYEESEQFGTYKDYDGAKISYIDPFDDTEATLVYPDDSAASLHEEKLIGVRNKVQAHTHLMRVYNKDQYTYKSCEITAGDESNIVVRRDRVTIASQLDASVIQGETESITTDGSDIVLWSAYAIKLDPAESYTMFLQTINNGVEAIEVTPRDDYSVYLSRLPTGEVSVSGVVQATFEIVSAGHGERSSFLVAEKSPAEGFSNKLTCTNYDPRFYQNDSDYINDLIEP